ncbi:MAG: hypothetical protein K2Q34_07065 [Alphaproteobacteria bacterium]|nr:hypothetical protein [Alphaproteobacteria bacterium]
MKTHLFETGHENTCSIEDIKVFNLTISQRENETAFAKLVVKRDDALSKIPLYGSIVCEHDSKKHLLFKGKRVGFPRQMAEDLAEIEYTSEPDDANEQLRRLSESLKQPLVYDELFIAPADENPINVLEARSDLFTWDRCRGTVSLSNLFGGGRVFDLSNNILTDSLKMSLGDTLLDSVTVEISAEWIQKAEGKINLFSAIAKKFPKRMVNTLTPDQLVKQWPKAFDKIGPAASLKQSGYQVVQSKLKPFTPPTTGILDIYPTVTPLITMLNDGKPESVRLKRSWFKGELWVYWHYFQKRREVVHFTLHQSSQLKGHIRAKQKILRLQLQSLENVLVNSGASSFFISERGQMAITHALEIAKAHLAGSSRCIEIEFEVPLLSAVDVTLNDSVYIKSDKIPGGEVTGKVTEYNFSITPSGAIAKIRLSVAAGIQETPINNLPVNDGYVEEDYCLEKQHSHFITPSEIRFKSYHHQTPKEGLLNPYGLSLHDFIKRIDVKGDAEKQCQHLFENEYPARENTLSCLNEMPTVIDVELLDLRTKGMLEHHIYLDVLGSWSAPRQIGLG